jgi:tRNA(adenine34) deaminase
MKRPYTKDEYMKKALDQAKRAYKAEEIPVGAIIVKNDEIIARGYNHKETKKNALRHAEIEAIEKALKKTGSKYLDDCEMYVTLEPCIMCAGVIINTRIKKLYIGTLDQKGGFIRSNIDISKQPGIHHKLAVETGILQEECERLLKEFFMKLRNREK